MRQITTPSRLSSHWICAPNRKSNLCPYGTCDCLLNTVALDRSPNSLLVGNFAPPTHFLRSLLILRSVRCIIVLRFGVGMSFVLLLKWGQFKLETYFSFGYTTLCFLESYENFSDWSE